MGYKELFEFTRQERNGIIVFFVLSFIVCLTAEFWPTQNKSHLDPDLAAYYIPIDSVIQEHEFDENINEYNYPSYQKKDKLVKQRFKFDPNTLSYDSILLLGFSKFGAKSLSNFVSKGGKIKDIEKLKTIFGLDTNLINQLETLISFEAGIKQTDFAERKEQVYEKIIAAPKIIDINLADSIEWVSIKGIGPYTASKILKYRNRLGGFLNIDQFKESGLLKDSLYDVLLPQFEVNPLVFNQININTADYKEFMNHPFFTTETASAIIKYRTQHGNFKDPKHISRIKSLKEAWGIKILPYLKVE